MSNSPIRGALDYVKIFTRIGTAVAVVGKHVGRHRETNGKAETDRLTFRSRLIHVRLNLPMPSHCTIPNRRRRRREKRKSSNKLTPWYDGSAL